MRRSPRHLRLILNGKETGNEELRAAVVALREEGHQIEVAVTWEKGDACRLARRAALDEVPTVVASGGDGTVNEVVTGIVDGETRGAKAPSLGIVPLGTANDFARSAEIPLTPAEALALIIEHPPTDVDTALVGSHSFLNVATGGFGTQVTVETPDELKKLLGGAAYFLTGLTKFNSLKTSVGRFRGPDFEWEGEFLVLAVGNGRQAGGGQVLCPEAYIDDGLLDVRILPNTRERELGSIISQLLKEGFGSGGASITARVPWLEIEAEDGIDLNLDGEPVEDRKFRFEVRGGALSLHLPATSPLLRANAALASA